MDLLLAFRQPFCSSGRRQEALEGQDHENICASEVFGGEKTSKPRCQKLGQLASDSGMN